MDDKLNDRAALSALEEATTRAEQAERAYQTWHRRAKEEEGDAIMMERRALAAESRADEALRAHADAQAQITRASQTIDLLTKQAMGAEARADALQAERDEMEKSKWYERDRRKEAESRADAAWRAALEAAAHIAFLYHQEEADPGALPAAIRALPPPSATPNEET